MYVFKKNQIIITALVVMIAIAGYLNYADHSADQDNMVYNEGTSDDINLAEGTLVPNEDDDYYQETMNTAVAEENSEIEIPNDASESEDVSKSTEDTGAAVFVNSDAVETPFFVQAKLDREQSRAKRKEILYDMINNENVDKDKKAEAADQVLQLQERIEKETAAEAMIEAKGFNEVYVRMDDTTVDVVVDSPALSQAEVAQIEDIVRRKTGAEAENIRISPIKAKN